MQVLEFYFGLSWLDTWVMSPNAEQRGLLKITNSTDYLISNTTVIHLAEILLNLQNVEGFWNAAKSMLSSGPEVGFSEFNSGELLRRLGIEFMFHSTSGRIGADYDIRISIDGHTVCGETKCKITDTAISENSIIQSIRKAQRQLPKTLPGIVFVHVPQSWDVSSLASLYSAVEKYLLSTGRLVGVFVHTWHIFVSDNIPAPMRIWKFVPNRFSIYWSDKFETFGTDPKQSLSHIDLVKVWGPAIMGSEFASHMRFNNLIHEKLHNLPG